MGLGKGHQGWNAGRDTVLLPQCWELPGVEGSSRGVREEMGWPSPREG